jgi:alpha-ketoglutaric semialdehyde dehydrogenase
VVLPGALEHGDIEALADGFVGSLTMGAGQFCTNPGVVFVPEGEPGDAFVAAAAAKVRESVGQVMLTPTIAEAYRNGLGRLRAAEGIDVLAEGTPGEGRVATAPVLSHADLGTDGGRLALEEVFGAASAVVRYSSAHELADLFASLEGQLTATVRYDPSDAEAARALLPVLEDRVGRILFNGWPTGVEVGHAMVHGGPFPATTDSRTTSVGSRAIERFQRPVCYQDVPADLLPEPVRDDNPWRLARRVDGELGLPAR